MEQQINKHWDNIYYYAIRIFGAALPYFFYIFYKKYRKLKRIKTIVSGVISLSKIEASERFEIIKDVNYLIYLCIQNHKSQR